MLKQKLFIPKFSTEFSEYFESIGKPDKLGKQYYEWLKSKYCIVSGYPCEERHHIRTKWNSGTSMRPDDIWAVPATQEVHVCMWHKYYDHMDKNRAGTNITGEITEWVVDQIKLLHKEFFATLTNKETKT